MKRALLIIAITAVLTVPLGASAAVRLVRLTSPVSPGDSVTLSVRVAPSRVTCSVAVVYRGRPLRSAALKPKRASGGRVTWTWRLGKLTATGRWPIYVRCGAAGSIKTSVVVRRAAPKEPPNIVIVIADDQAALE